MRSVVKVKVTPRYIKWAWKGHGPKTFRRASAPCSTYNSTPGYAPAYRVACLYIYKRNNRHYHNHSTKIIQPTVNLLTTMKFSVSLLLSLCVHEWCPVHWSLHATINNKPVFEMGEVVIVEVTLTNNHPVDYFILKRFTPLEGLEGLRAYIFTVTTSKGSILPYDGLMFRRGPAQKDEYIEIRANSSISSTATLSNAYGFCEVGNYLVKLSTTITFASSLDVTPATELLVSNTNRFMLTVSDKLPYLRIGETHRRKEVRQKIDDFSVFDMKTMKNPRFGGKWMEDATNVAFQVLLKATDLACSVQCSTTKIYDLVRQTWFGRIDYSGDVKSVLQDCTADMQVYSYNGLSVPSECQPGDYA